MKAVITGSNGFIGSSLTRRLLDEGAEVRCLVRKASPAASDGVRRITVDYGDPTSLKECGALDDADVIFHVAGVTKALSLDAFRLGNVAPTRNLLDATVERNPALKRFILVSSQAAAGPAASNDQPVTESIAPAPIDDYGRSKLEAEDLLRTKDLPFSYSIIRPTAVYGPLDVDFFKLFRQLQIGAGIYPGNRDSYVALIHVDDLVDGIMLAARADAASNQTYFLTHETAVTWREIYRIIADILDRRIIEANVPLGIMELAARLGDLFSRITGKITLLNSTKIDMVRPRYWVCSAEKAMEELGFRPQIAMHQGFKQTLAWYRAHGWIQG